MGEILTVKECAKMARRSVDGFRKWADRRGLKRVPNQGRKVLYYRADILTALGLDRTQPLQSLGSSSGFASGSDVPTNVKYLGSPVPLTA